MESWGKLRSVKTDTESIFYKYLNFSTVCMASKFAQPSNPKLLLGRLPLEIIIFLCSFFHGLEHLQKEKERENFLHFLVMQLDSCYWKTFAKKCNNNNFSLFFFFLLFSFCSAQGENSMNKNWNNDNERTEKIPLGEDERKKISAVQQ